MNYITGKGLNRFFVRNEMRIFFFGGTLNERLFNSRDLIDKLPLEAIRRWRIIYIVFLLLYVTFFLRLFLFLFSICKFFLSICKLLLSICKFLFSICKLFLSICKLFLSICKFLFSICKLLFSICKLLFFDDCSPVFFDSGFLYTRPERVQVRVIVMEWG